MISTRIPPHGEINRITRAVEQYRAAGESIVDLTASNPTSVGVPYPTGLVNTLADPRVLTYAPDPLGLRTAREAVAAEFARRGAPVDPAHLVLSASTSEAYSWLFKLLCDPGDAVLIPQPSYPLFEHLTRLEGVSTAGYRLSFHGRWEIDFGSLVDAPARTRAVLVVSPNNPTGSFLTRRELDALLARCRERRWALIVDEVFADYPVEPPGDAVIDVAADAGVLAFTLGGASKSVGLPQMKLGWMLVGGPPEERDAALTALELIADTFLSVGTPVQVAAPRLLAEGAMVRTAILARVRENLATARALARVHSSCSLLPVEGGWFVIVRVPATRSEERLVLDLLEHDRVLVHPGFFFDLPHEAFLVISLLPPPRVFADAFARVLLQANSLT
ncbi:MAG TPA: pyridoxal phosphate-dependent aminotransferase [Vicinamibacterales bacterium]|nr:pyridoxal phosphate-dependent aminotransferase [Vicinamibacterales bacterium]